MSSLAANCSARAAAGGAFLTLPGIARRLRRQQLGELRLDSGDKTLAKTLRFSNWTLYIDIDEKTKKHPTLDEFKKKTGTTVQYTEDINDNAHVLREDPGPAVARPVDRPRHHRDDRQLALSVAADQEGLGREARQERDPEHQEPAAALQHPNWDPNRDYSLPWQSGHDGHRVQRQAHGARRSRSTTCSRTRSSRARSRC